MNDWVLFGTGNRLRIHLSLIEALGEKPIALCDNDANKWGNKISGIEIISPDRLRSLKCRIVISTDYYEEIKQQLLDMGIDENDIYDHIRLMHLYVNRQSVADRIEVNPQDNEKRTIIIDAYDGIGWGGMEIWSYQIAEELTDRGHLVRVFGAEDQIKQPNWENLIDRFPYDRFGDGFYWQPIDVLVEGMKDKLPLTLVNNWSFHMLCAGIILKKKYPRLVRIVTMVHNDIDFFYNRVCEFQEEMDQICCVSHRIRDELVGERMVPSSKVLSKMNYVRNPHALTSNSREGKRIKIGWGGRLEKIQKRADLLPELIDKLNKVSLDYELEIAGDGEWFEFIEKFIVKEKLEDRVTLLGVVEKDKMEEFWNRQHIYINLSEYEGLSLAMLEAMSCECVPVVTSVSGVDEVVVDHENGLVSTPGDLDGIVDHIVFLANNEDVRLKYAKRSREIVMEKCNYNDYMDYMERLICGEP